MHHGKTHCWLHGRGFSLKGLLAPCGPELNSSLFYFLFKVFDVQRKITYKNLTNWYKELREYRPEIPCCVVANKIDGGSGCGASTRLKLNSSAPESGPILPPSSVEIHFCVILLTNKRTSSGDFNMLFLDLCSLFIFAPFFLNHKVASRSTDVETCVFSRVQLIWRWHREASASGRSRESPSTLCPRPTAPTWLRFELYSPAVLMVVIQEFRLISSFTLCHFTTTHNSPFITQSQTSSTCKSV